MIQQEQGLKGYQNTLNLNSISYLRAIATQSKEKPHRVYTHSQELCVCVHVCVYCEDGWVNLNQGENDKKTCTRSAKQVVFGSSGGIHRGEREPKQTMRLIQVKIRRVGMNSGGGL